MRGLMFETLITYPVCVAVAVSHPLAGKRSISLARLRQERLMGYSRDEYPEYFDWITHLFRPQPFEPNAMEGYDSATGLIAAVEAGRGVAIVSTSMKCLTGPRVKLLPFAPALPPLIVGALTSKPVAPLTERFIAAIKKIA
jgi:DNA-binding transcriptional LysR family regulator